MELTVIEQDNKLLIDSREVAEMVGKKHAHLMRDIKNYIGAISTNPKLDSLDFFIENSYTDGKGELRPSYLLTKQGCEMVGNKMTGQKGIQLRGLLVYRVVPGQLHTWRLNTKMVARRWFLVTMMVRLILLLDLLGYRRRK